MASLAQYFKNSKVVLQPKFEKLVLRNRRRPDDLLEFEVFGKVEPLHAFTEIHREGMSVGKRKFDNMMKIAQRPGHSEEVIAQLYKKFKDSKRGEELEGILEAQYDPLGPFVELQNMDEQVKIVNITEDSKKVKLMEIAGHVLIAAVLLLLLQFLGDFGGFAKMKELDPILTIVAILLWHVLQEFLEIKVMMAFTRSELMRIRASCTTGNLVQLLMRTELKLNFIERRSMKFYAKANDFYRVLQEEFLDVPWRSQIAGHEKFGSLVAEYIEGKIQRGLKIDELTEDEKNEFTKTLQESLTYYLYLRFNIVLYDCYMYIYIHIYIYIYPYIIYIEISLDFPQGAPRQGRQFVGNSRVPQARAVHP
jgi:hypothetical protein